MIFVRFAVARGERMQPEAEFIQVMTTTEKREDAERLAERAVSERLAACAQVIGPIHSTYRWQGKIERAEEWLCLMKTRPALYDALEAAIKEIHPYSVPEILAVPVVAGSADYLAWMRAELRPEPPSA
jgi:periplasmic divalent cation tolerance protein